MKILAFNWQCIKNPLSGGAEVHFHEIFKRIAAQGHSVTLVCCKFDGAKTEEIIDGINIIRVGNRELFNYFVPRAYKKLIKKDNYDLIIDDINKIPFYLPLFVKKPLLAISHHFFGKSIFKEVGFISASYVYMSEKLINLVYKKTKFCVVSNSTLEEFLFRGFNKDNFNVVFNAIAQEEFPMQISDKSEVPTIAYFGRMKKYKSVDHILQAFAIVKKNIPNAKLEMLGAGDFLPFLKNLAQELNIADSVNFHGFVSNADKIKLLSSSHCVINSSIKEGWGITNIEANACGTPVVSANSPGLRDSVSNGLSGLLYQYGNIAELAEKIILILENEKLRIKLSEGALEWAKRFSWDNSAKEMLKVCESVIANKKAAKI